MSIEETKTGEKAEFLPANGDHKGDTRVKRVDGTDYTSSDKTLVLAEVFPGANLLIDGEIPRGIYLLIGNSGSGKTSFCKTFIARGLSNKETGIYLSTEQDCREIQASIQKLMNDQDRTKAILGWLTRIPGAFEAPRATNHS